MPRTSASRPPIPVRRLLGPLTALALTAAATVAAQPWQPLGPEGGPLWSLAADPEDPAVIYTGGGGFSQLAGCSGVFRSADAGSSWTALLDSPAPPFDAVSELAVGAGGELYALYLHSGKLHRSGDGGDSWVEAPWIDQQSVPTTLAPHPATPGRLFAGSFTGLYRSDDAGDTWNQVDTFPLDPGPPTLPSPSYLGVEALVFSPSGATLWAATDVGGVFRSDDDGETWLPASGGLPDRPFARDLTRVPGTPDDLVLATAESIYRTSDGGATWARTGAVPDFVRALAVDPVDPNRLWATTFGALYVSGDGGATWSPVAGGLPPVVNAVLPGPPGSGRVSAATDEGLYTSDDRGVTWSRSVSGLFAHAVRSLDVHPGAPDRLLATADGTVFRSPDAGVSWSSVRAGGHHRVAASPADPDVVYATESHAVWRSPDSGTTWLPAGSFEPFLGGLWTDPDDPDTLFVSAHLVILFGSDPVYLLRSANGGQSWETVWSYADVAVWDLAAGPTSSPQPAVHLLSTDLGLLRSLDGGITWQPLAATGLGPLAQLVELTADPSTAGRFLGAVFGAGLYETLDAGDSWHPTGAGLPAGSTPRLLFDPQDPLEVWGAVDGTGVFRSLDGGVTWIDSGSGAATDRLSGALDLGITGEPRRLFAGTARGVWSRAITPEPCTAGPQTLCLQNGRFEVRVAWQDFQGGSGAGRTHPLTGDTGAFWFFRPDNLELAVKVLDGRALNDHWWVFYGSLSNVPFTLTVRDTETGQRRTYDNPPRTFASRGDTRGFPALPPPAAAASGPASAVAAATASGGALTALPQAAHPGGEHGACEAGPTALCLAGGRFRVEVAWQDFQGGSGAGRTHPLTGDTGAFWFFRPDNLELLVKVLDARPVNGHWWVFYGSLSNVPFTLTVTDTVTGMPRVYTNPPRTFASRGDTAAF